MRIWSAFCKLIQKQTYSCLSRNYGVWFAFAGLCIILVSAFHFGEVALEWNMMRYASNFKFGRYYDNIHGQSFETRLCLPQPIDVVYTWVNGSDPNLIELLNQYKETILLSSNKTVDKEVKPIILVEKFNWKNSSICPFKNCFLAKKLAVSGLPNDITLPELTVDVDSRFTSAIGLEFFDEIAIISFDSQDTVKNLTFSNLKYRKTHLNLREVFYTDTNMLENQKLFSSLMILNLKNEETNISIAKSIELILPYSVKEVIFFKETKSAVIHFTKQNYVQMLINERNVSSYGSNLFFVSLVWKPFISSSNDRNTDLTSNRFADNSELKYSLRSIDAFAPWVRKIFIVTNGQIPSWLNLDHPRIELVAHEEIFANKSHLPTFSSPAIESNIHRIPGLSKKFIYMNDDVFFGKEVWPDDFYTHSKGQKIFQAWAVPNCHEGCPSSWLSDKYCDKACNYTECEWDGGDCINMKGSANSLIQAMNINGNQNNLINSYCSNGCANSWLGDRYCDGNCNTLDCGFDAGDCGIQNFNKLFSYHFPKEQLDNSKVLSIKVPSGTLSMFLNLTNVFQDLVEGNYQTNEILRSAVLGKKSKLLSLTFFKNYSEEIINFQILGYKGANNTGKEVLAFTLIVDTKIEQTFKKKVIIEKERSVLYPQKLYNHSLYPLITKSNVSFEQVNLGNLTLSNTLKNRLKILEQNFMEGDITANGFNKEKYELYKEHLHETQKLGRKLFSLEDKDSKPVQLTKLLMDPFTTVFSFLPWEKDGFLHNMSTLSRKLEKQHKYLIGNRKGRKLFDTFSSSLLHVSRIYNKAFGYQLRKVPAHMPHMVDKDIIAEMQKQFQPYFDDTSSHKMRHPEDMQFAFSYNYYLIGVKEAQNVSLLFDRIDSDHSGTLSDREMRTLAAMLFTIPITIVKIKELETMFKNCSLRLYGPKNKAKDKVENYHDIELPLITKNLFLDCHEVWQSLTSLNNSETKYKFELLGEDDVTFKMLQNNVSFVLQQLDWIRKNPKKFICLNDDLDHADESTSTIRVILKDFYEAFFPIPSQFELKPKFRNKFLYKKDLLMWLANERFNTKIKNIALVSILIMIIFGVYHKKLLGILRNSKYFFRFYKRKFLNI